MLGYDPFGGGPFGGMGEASIGPEGPEVPGGNLADSLTFSLGEDWKPDPHRKFIEAYHGTGSGGWAVESLEADWPDIDGRAVDIVRRGNLLYVGYLCGLQVLDLSDWPTATEVGRVDVPLPQVYKPFKILGVGQMRVGGGLLYMPLLRSGWFDEHYTDLLVFDVRETVPVYSDGLPGASRVGAYHADYAVTDDRYVYYPHRPGSVRIYRCSEEGDCGIAGGFTVTSGLPRWPDPKCPRSITVAGDLLAVDDADEEHRGVRVYDISGGHRWAPGQVGHVGLSGGPGIPIDHQSPIEYMRWICDGRVLVYLQQDRMRQIDVSDPTNPRLLAGEVDLRHGPSPADADSFGGVYFLREEYGTGFLRPDPLRRVPVAWVAYAGWPTDGNVMSLRGVCTGHRPIPPNTSSALTPPWGIIGGSCGVGGIDMFTDPLGVDWLVTVGWSMIHVMHTTDNARTWTAWETGKEQAVELPDSGGYDAATIAGDGTRMTVAARRTNDRHLYAWYSRDQGRTWTGPEWISRYG